MSTRDRDLGLERILEEMRALDGAVVKVGIQDDAGVHDESNLTIAEIAYINEYGTSDGRIPARPAHRQAFDDNQNSLSNIKARLVKGVQNGRIDSTRALKILGETHQANIQDSITNLSTPANAPATIERKGSSNPLIDTGQTRQSVRYVIED